MNVEKHECSLLKEVSDVGSTPTASTNQEFEEKTRLASVLYRICVIRHRKLVERPVIKSLGMERWPSG